MQSPLSPLHLDSGVTSQGRGRVFSNKIDHTKLRTRVCRHFMEGNVCPFQERCAFSHSDSSSAMGVQSPVSRTSEPTSPASYQPRTYGNQGGDAVPMESNLIGEDGQHDAAGSMEIFGEAPPPYDVAISGDLVVSADDCVMPPAYPSRYRYNPYSFKGVLYEQ